MTRFYIKNLSVSFYLETLYGQVRFSNDKRVIFIKSWEIKCLRGCVAVCVAYISVRITSKFGKRVFLDEKLVREC